MFVEERIYTLHPGKVPEFLRHWEELAKPAFTPGMDHLLGYYTTEYGPLNQIIHLWRYEDLADRDNHRKEFASHANWPAFVAAILPLIDSQEVKVLNPVSWSP